jgi:hypothetical protein
LNLTNVSNKHSSELPAVGWQKDAAAGFRAVEALELTPEGSVSLLRDSGQMADHQFPRVAMSEPRHKTSYPSIYLSINLFIYLFTYLFIYSSIDSSIHSCSPSIDVRLSDSRIRPSDRSRRFCGMGRSRLVGHHFGAGWPGQLGWLGI